MTRQIQQDTVNTLSTTSFRCSLDIKSAINGALHNHSSAAQHLWNIRLRRLKAESLCKTIASCNYHDRPTTKQSEGCNRHCSLPIPFAYIIRLLHSPT